MGTDDVCLSYSYYQRKTVRDLKNAIKNGYEIINLGYVYQAILPNGFRETFNGISEILFEQIKKEVLSGGKES